MRLKYIYLLTLLAMISGCVSEEYAQDDANEVLIVRVPRKKLANYLLDDGIKFYQQGQTITLLVPANVIYLQGSSNEQIRAKQVYSDIVKYLNTYRIEKLEITAGSYGSSGNFAKDFAENRAQIFASNIRRYGLNTPIILTKGEVSDKLNGKQGYGLSDYIILEFRFLRVLV